MSTPKYLGAHRGYLVTHSLTLEEWYVSKGGAHIAGFTSYEEAIKAIDDLLDWKL